MTSASTWPPRILLLYRVTTTQGGIPLIDLGGEIAFVLANFAG